MKLRIALIFLTCVNTSVHADLSQCEGTRDAKKRLACYDSLAKQSAKLKIMEADKERAAQDEKQRAGVERLAKEKEKALGSATDALKALKRFEARVSTGVSYKDYSAPLGEAKFEVSQFAESPAGKIFPEVAEALNGAIKHYLTAGDVWRVRFSSGGRISDLMPRFESPELYDMIVSKYSLTSYDGRGILYSAALPVIWIYASGDIKKAQLLIQAGGSTPKVETIERQSPQL